MHPGRGSRCHHPHLSRAQVLDSVVAGAPDLRGLSRTPPVDCPGCMADRRPNATRPICVAARFECSGFLRENSPNEQDGCTQEGRADSRCTATSIRRRGAGSQSLGHHSFGRDQHTIKALPPQCQCDLGSLAFTGGRRHDFRFAVPGGSRANLELDTGDRASYGNVIR
jgi:hypothetical protein